MISQQFPRAARLLSSAQFKAVQHKGKRLLGTAVVITFQDGRSICSRLGITVSRKYGRAHDRNRFKRVVREAFRQFAPSLTQHLDVHISPRSSTIPLSTPLILNDLKQHLLDYLNQ